MLCEGGEAWLCDELNTTRREEGLQLIAAAARRIDVRMVAGLLEPEGYVLRLVKDGIEDEEGDEDFYYGIFYSPEEGLFHSLRMTAESIGAQGGGDGDPLRPSWPDAELQFALLGP